MIVAIVTIIYIGLSFLCALTLWAACAVGGRADTSNLVATQHPSGGKNQP